MMRKFQLTIDGGSISTIVFNSHLIFKADLNKVVRADTTNSFVYIEDEVVIYTMMRDLDNFFYDLEWRMFGPSWETKWFTCNIIFDGD